MQHHGQFYTLIGLVSLPLTLVSTALVPLDVMPGWLAVLARLNPMTYAIDGARALVLGGMEATRVGLTAAAVLLFDVLMVAAAGRVARRALG